MARFNILHSWGQFDFLIPTYFVCVTVTVVSMIQTWNKQSAAKRDYEIIQAIGSETELFTTKEQIKHIVKQASKVWYPHQIRLLLEGKNLEQTMPIGEADAYVISFDIIGSSKIKSETAKQLFRKVFSECNRLMMQGYQADSLTAQAFRLKEMGDGFICTVGFPFSPPKIESDVKTALNISLGFVEIFRIAAQDLDTPLYCGIGIAFGKVEGFYSEAKPIEYDLFGRGIILSTRYEQMRKVILEELKANSNIIVFQERVFEMLPADISGRCTEYLMSNHGKKVRDDEEADRLHFMLLN